MVQRVIFSLICIAISALFGWLLREAYLDGRIQYGNFFGRKLNVRRDEHPTLFWIAFTPGVLFCIGMVQLAIRGPAALGF